MVYKITREKDGTYTVEKDGTAVATDLPTDEAAARVVEEELKKE